MSAQVYYESKLPSLLFASHCEDGQLAVVWHPWKGWSLVPGLGSIEQLQAE